MHRNTWKRREREAAAFFGAKRNVLSGSAGRDDRGRSDTSHPRLFIEVKARANCPVWNAWDKSDPDCIALVAGGLFVVHESDLDSSGDVLWTRSIGSLSRLYGNTMNMAIKEDKVPVLMLYRKGRQGALIVFEYLSDIYETVIEERRKAMEGGGA